MDVAPSRPDPDRMRTRTRAEDLAALARSERNRYVDLLRAMSILVVVVGHWLMAAPQVLPDGTLRAGHLLADVPRTQWLTWAFQIIPVFFFVGGFSNAASWRSARGDGVPYGRWLRDRLRRLLVPVFPLLAVWGIGAVVALRTGIDPDLFRIGSQAALVPVWFLATYVVVVTTSPSRSPPGSGTAGSPSGYWRGRQQPSTWPHSVSASPASGG